MLQEFESAFNLLPLRQESWLTRPTAQSDISLFFSLAPSVLSFREVLIVTSGKSSDPSGQL
jgi:hypothetical protein